MNRFFSRNPSREVGLHAGFCSRRPVKGRGRPGLWRRALGTALGTAWGPGTAWRQPWGQPWALGQPWGHPGDTLGTALGPDLAFTHGPGPGARALGSSSVTVVFSSPALDLGSHQPSFSWPFFPFCSLSVSGPCGVASFTASAQTRLQGTLLKLCNHGLLPRNKHGAILCVFIAVMVTNQIIILIFRIIWYISYLLLCNKPPSKPSSLQQAFVISLPW